MSDKTTKPDKTRERLLSLDAFRGADMLCILGLDALIYCLAQAYSGNGFLSVIAQQFSHKSWESLALYDCVFPAFVFISGIAMAFSFAKNSSRGNAKSALALVRRGVILVALGAILQGALSFNVPETRFASVLGLIGVANTIGGLLALFLKTPRKIVAAIAIIAGTLAAAQFLGGDFTPENSLNAKIDRLFLPGKFHNGNYDPEGIVCILSASVPVLIGYLTGLFILKNRVPAWRNAGILAGCALVLIFFAWGIGAFYPIIKNLWTQSFVFASTGFSLLAFSLFYILFDVLNLQKLAFFFKIIGVNAIAIYVLQWIFPFWELSNLLFGGVAKFAVPASAAVVALGVIVLKWLLLFWLDRKKIHFKI